jgi:hypothetical protein
VGIILLKKNRFIFLYIILFLSFKKNYVKFEQKCYIVFSCDKNLISHYKSTFNQKNVEALIPKGQRVFLLKTASKQPLLKTSRIVQNWN